MCSYNSYRKLSSNSLRSGVMMIIQSGPLNLFINQGKSQSTEYQNTEYNYFILQLSSTQMEPFIFVFQTLLQTLID